MTRAVRISEARSGLSARFELLDQLAPQSCAALWALAQDATPREALHAMWTGPELSCPLAAGDLPAAIDVTALTLENAVRHPNAGELVLTVFDPGPIGPARPFVDGGLDLGIFYGDGGRLLFPVGWIEGSLCARVSPEDLDGLASAARLIRRQGVCELQLEPIT
ncbi:DUF3830 family protein [Caulobacter sp. NIBR2454]|uniref:DUF3830 family protein n=1 Tax=Caulobacter sp. NIBR2454 TaxID=3015996 RepID=UPI0022B6D323|nr:DUF3830 family protein [Caulobacter sp. NIBR2454]